MVQKILVSYQDDIDGTKAVGTVAFSYDGKDYEIDLSRKNANQLEKKLAPFIAAGRKVTRARSKPGRRTTSSNGNGPKPADVRAWARREGFEVKDMGRVPAELIVKFQAAE
jgi:Lsr2